MEQNKVYLEPSGYIHVTAVGMQTFGSVKETENQVGMLVKQLRSQHRPVKIVIELSPGVRQGLAARQAAKQFLVNLDYDKIGMYGAKLFLKNVIDLIIASSMRGGKVKNFYTEAEAKTWLAD